jgi:hypothetical protein
MAPISFDLPSEVAEDLFGGQVSEVPVKVEPKPAWFVGVDLGQLVDSTAIAVVERLAMQQGQKLPNYVLRSLSRPALGTPYTTIVEELRTLLATPQMKGAHLVVDATGVGVAVVEMFRLVKLEPVKVTITGGDNVHHADNGHWRVPKRDLAGVLHVLFSSKRIKLSAPEQDIVKKLVQELQTFRVKVNISTGHDSFEALREGDHDDLVLALALACWYGERTSGSAGRAFGVPFTSVMTGSDW